MSSSNQVATEHVSSVKHLILQHLPVFKMSSGGGDSQLINSVYFDNRQMQLYHGRMDKTPGLSPHFPQHSVSSKRCGIVQHVASDSMCRGPCVGVRPSSRAHKLVKCSVL